MVYYGPSQGCETCKRRRKKCDGTRPACLRCWQANRECGGYAIHANVNFRNWNTRDRNLQKCRSLARKCSLPPGSGPGDVLPMEVSSTQAEDFALGAFIYDYCIQPENRQLSRGVLSNLESMLHHHGMNSDLAKACKAVAFLNRGIALNRGSLIRHAQILHDQVLGHFARNMANSAMAYSPEALATSMFLGLYEMFNAGDSRPCFLNTHASGVNAIMQAENSPLGLLQALKCPRTDYSTMPTGMLRNHGLFSVPSSSSSPHDLDSLLISFGSIWRRANDLSANPPPALDETYLLKQEAICLNQKFATWQDAQIDSFKPRTVGHVAERQVGTNPGVGYWPGKVDTYFDLYVANVWNTYRVVRCLLISLIFNLSSKANDGVHHGKEQQDVVLLVKDITASIPYHLTENLHAFLGEVLKGKEITDAGRAAGGLFLMQPLYILSRLAIVPARIRNYLRECLTWIGRHMGIGQASLYAEEMRDHQQSFADACTILMVSLVF